MNEPGLTRKIVASHLQKYRICLKKSQEETDRYFQAASNGAAENSQIPNGNYQQRYLGTSQHASNNYPISCSLHSSLYGIRTRIGASSTVRLAPPSYWCFDVSSLPAVKTGNMQNQHIRRMEANTSFGDYGHEEGNILVRTFKERPCSYNSDPPTSSSTSNSAFMGLRFADDGKSLTFGRLDRIVSTGNYSTKRNDLNYQRSEAPEFSCYAQVSPLLPLPDSEDYMEEPPLPEINVENSLPGPETEENESMNLILQQETCFGTSQNVDINSFFFGDTSTMPVSIKQ